MNKFARVFVFYIFVIAIAAAVEVSTKLQSSSRIQPNSKSQDQSKKASSASKQTIAQFARLSQESPVSKPNYVSAHAVVSGGMVGVASVAGVDSRNGRYSSISGFKFYPPIEPSKVKSDRKGAFFFKSATDDDQMSEPVTITKQDDGVTGTIRIRPGSVSVSSSAKDGGSSSASAISGPRGFDSWVDPFIHPIFSDMYFPTFSSFPTFTTIPKMPPFPSIREPSFPKIPEYRFPRIPEPSFSDPWMEKRTYKQTYPRREETEPRQYYPTFPYLNFWR